MYSSLIFQNKTTKIVKFFRSYNYFNFLFKDFFIDENTFIKENTGEEMTELSEAVRVQKGIANNLTIEGGTRLVGFLLANTKNSRLLADKDLDLQNSDAYDFTHLVPPIDLYKDIIESFVIRNRLLSEAEFQAKFKPQNTYENSAKARIHRHLAYKLGAAMVRNSKSFFGYLKMPFVLIALAISHKEELKGLQGVKFAPLESYSDYNEALKEKECFTYKLGLALMKANKNLLKGGYFKFFFKDLPKLKKELKKKKLKSKF